MNSQEYRPSPLAAVDRTLSAGRWTLVFTRDLSHPVETVWAAITDPEHLRDWAPYRPSRDLRSVGEATLTMQGDDLAPGDELPGTVLRVEPPHILEHRWGEDTLRWELAPTGEGTRLTLRHTVQDERMLSAMAAGWHICLDVADALLAGVPFGPVVGTKAREYGWDRLNVEYAQSLGIDPAQVWTPSE